MAILRARLWNTFFGAVPTSPEAPARTRGLTQQERTERQPEILQNDEHVRNEHLTAGIPRSCSVQGGTT